MKIGLPRQVFSETRAEISIIKFIISGTYFTWFIVWIINSYPGQERFLLPSTMKIVSKMPIKNSIFPSK